MIMKCPFASSSILLASLLLSQTVFLQSVSAADANERGFNVRNFGAVGDGKNLDSPAIDKAIQAAAEGGGGTVYLPPGKYLSGTIHLASNIHLIIEAGA